MTPTPDVLEWIRLQLAGSSAASEIESILHRARLTYGGETVYIRTPEPQKVARRTVQRRMRIGR